MSAPFKETGSAPALEASGTLIGSLAAGERVFCDGEVTGFNVMEMRQSGTLGLFAVLDFVLREV
jgi:hypothetical protein